MAVGKLVSYKLEMISSTPRCSQIYHISRALANNFHDSPKNTYCPQRGGGIFCKGLARAFCVCKGVARSFSVFERFLGTAQTLQSTAFAGLRTSPML